MSLEHSAFYWLHWVKKCHAVLHERTPRYQTGSPDVLGMTRSRYLIEIEIKRSVSDFKKNETKYHVANRQFWLKNWPRQVYFFVPEEILEKVQPLTPEWAGLAVDRSGFTVIKEAPINAESKKVTVKECAKMFHLMSNQLYSQSQTIAGFIGRWQWHNEPWIWSPEI